MFPHKTGACIGGQKHHGTKISAADSGGQVATTSAAVSSGDQHISTTAAEGSNHQVTSITIGERPYKQKATTAPGSSERGDNADNY